MKAKMLVVLFLLLASVLVGALPATPARAATCQHVPNIWVSRFDTFVINFSWECPPRTIGPRTGQITIRVPNGVMGGYHNETYQMLEASGIEDPPTSILWNIPPNPYPGHYQAYNQGLYRVVSGYVMSGGVRYDLPVTGMGNPVCLPNPNGYGC